MILTSFSMSTDLILREKGRRRCRVLEDHIDSETEENAETLQKESKGRQGSNFSPTLVSRSRLAGEEDIRRLEAKPRNNLAMQFRSDINRQGGSICFATIA